MQAIYHLNINELTTQLLDTLREQLKNSEVEIIIRNCNANSITAINSKIIQNKEENLIDFFKNSPLYDNENLSFSHNEDTGREINL